MDQSQFYMQPWDYQIATERLALEAKIEALAIRIRDLEEAANPELRTARLAREEQQAAEKAAWDAMSPYQQARSIIGPVMNAVFRDTYDK